MNLHLNLQSSRFNSPAIRWAFLVLPLAFSAVIGSSVPARAADGYNASFPPDEFPYESYYGIHVLITGAYEQVWVVDDIDAFYSLAGDATNRLWQVAWMVLGCASDLQWTMRDATAFQDAHPEIPQSELLWLGGVSYWAGALRSVFDDCTNGVAFVDEMAHAPEMQNVLSRAVYTADGDLTAFDGSGGCDCVAWLEDILTECQTINTNLNTWLQNIYYRLRTFTYGANSILGVSGEDYASRLGVYVGTNLLFSSSLGSRLEEWLSMPVYNRVASSSRFYGDETADSIAAVLTGFEQLFMYDNAPEGYSYGPYVEGMRDFAFTKNNHPTNTADNALWVRGLGDDGSISVSGTLDFDEDALRDLLQSIEFQIKNSLSQPSLHVTVDNTNDFQFADSSHGLYNQVQNNYTTIENVASEVQGQQAEYDDPDWTLDDYGTMFDFRSEMSNWDFVGKWQKMFDDVSIEPPVACKIWDGFAPNDGNDSGTPGPWGGWSQIIDIQSLYWHPMESSGGLIRSIRGVFRALWTIVILVVVAGLVRLNWLLARCGVRILIAVVSAFGAPDPMGAIVEVFETVLKAMSQLYTGLFGGRPAESD